MLPPPGVGAPEPNQQADSAEESADTLRTRFQRALDTGEAEEFLRLTNFGSLVDGATQSALLSYLGNGTPENRKAAELAFERSIQGRRESKQERSERLHALFDWARRTLEAGEYDTYIRGPLLERNTESALFEYVRKPTPENLNAVELALAQWISGKEEARLSPIRSLPPFVS